MEYLAINRRGEIKVMSQEDFDDMARGMTSTYLERIVKYAEPNKAIYINLETCGGKVDSIRMMLSKISQRLEVEIRSFTVGHELIGFVVIKPEQAFA